MTRARSLPNSKQLGLTLVHTLPSELRPTPPSNMRKTYFDDWSFEAVSISIFVGVDMKLTVVQIATFETKTCLGMFNVN